MKDILSQMQDLKRPGLLIRAARHGADSYVRENDLKRHVKQTPLPRSGAALMQLMELEAVLNTQRKSNDAGYNLITHVDVLIAMLGEARVLRASRRGTVPIT